MHGLGGHDVDGELGNLTDIVEGVLSHPLTHSGSEHDMERITRHHVEERIRSEIVASVDGAAPNPANRARNDESGPELVAIATDVGDTERGVGFGHGTIVRWVGPPATIRTMTALLDAARDLFDQLDAEAAIAEEAGTPMTDRAVALCRDAGVYGTMIARDAGGAELSIGDSLDVFKELARADGSTGWVVMASSSAAAYFSAWCPDSFVDDAFGGDQVPLVAGQFAPNGVATPCGDSYHITGSYNFGSGIEHAEWVGCGSFTAPDDGSPADYVFALVPKHEADISGNWDVLGLRATASYDYSIDSTVPTDRMFSFGAHTRHRGGPMYDLGVLCLTEVGHAGWVLGVLRRAIDEAAHIARTKQRMTGKTTLADDPRFQHDLAMAESTLQSGELWIRDAFRRAEQSVLDGNGPDPAADLDARQATTFLTQRACRVVQDLYLHIGTTALRDGPFQRCFRDLHAGSQHAMVSPMHTYEFANRLLAGPEA